MSGEKKRWTKEQKKRHAIRKDFIHKVFAECRHQDAITAGLINHTPKHLVSLAAASLGRLVSEVLSEHEDPQAGDTFIQEGILHLTTLLVQWVTTQNARALEES